jgi:hypothetical protein
MLEDLALKRAQAELEKPIRKFTGSRERIDELDHNTLYNMINAEDKRGKRKKEDESA